MRSDSEAREIDRQRARLATLSKVSCRITESWDLDTVLQEVVDGCPIADRRPVWGSRCL